MEPLDLHVCCLCYPLLDKLPKDLLPESFSTCSKAKKMFTKNRNIIGSLFEHPPKKNAPILLRKKPYFPGVEPLTLKSSGGKTQPVVSTCSPNHFFLTNPSKGTQQKQTSIQDTSFKHLPFQKMFHESEPLKKNSRCPRPHGFLV